MAGVKLLNSEECPESLCSSCFGFLNFFRFERPAERRVVTEHVQPSPTASTTLHDSLGPRTSSYQTMANMHRVSFLSF